MPDTDATAGPDLTEFQNVELTQHLMCWVAAHPAETVAKFVDAAIAECRRINAATAPAK